MSYRGISSWDRQRAARAACDLARATGYRPLKSSTNGVYVTSDGAGFICDLRIFSGEVISNEYVQQMPILVAVNKSEIDGAAEAAEVLRLIFSYYHQRCWPTVVAKRLLLYPRGVERFWSLRRSDIGFGKYRL